MVNPEQGSAEMSEPRSQYTNQSPEVSRGMPSTASSPTSTTSLPISQAVIEKPVEDIPGTTMMGMSNTEASSYYGSSVIQQNHNAVECLNDATPQACASGTSMSLLAKRPARASLGQMVQQAKVSPEVHRTQLTDSGKCKAPVGSMALKSLRRKLAAKEEAPTKERQKCIKAQAQQGHQLGGSQLLSLLTAPKAEIPGLKGSKRVCNEENDSQMDPSKQVQPQELPSVFMSEDYTITPSVPANMLSQAIPALLVKDHSITEALVDQDSVSLNWNSNKMLPYHSAANESSPKRPRLMESGSGFSSQISQGSGGHETIELRQKRFLRTREALEKSGLMGITMKTAELIHKNKILDQEIHQLKKDMQHFLKMMLQQPQNQNMQGLIIAKCASLLMSNKDKPS